MTDQTMHAPGSASPQIIHSVVLVDAAIATRWLARNAKNRRVRQSVVDRYRSDMLGGRWTFAADPIRFDVDGDLIDGQHRLIALSGLVGVSIPMLIVRGLAPEAQSVMDQGTKRTPGDQLGLAGIKNANNVASSVRQYLMWRDGEMFRDRNPRRNAAASSPRIEEWVRAHRDLVDAFNEIISSIRGNDAPLSISGAAALAFLQIDPRAAVEFFSLLANGAGTEGHPIVTLDKRLQRLRRDRVRLSDRDYLALFFQAWNAWRVGRSAEKFYRPSGGWSAENFPVPR